MKKSIIICLIMVLSFVSSVEILGHSVFLNVEYDECSKVEENTENNEKWYELIGITNGVLYNRHLSTDITTIKYYISDVGKDEDGQNVYWNSTGLTNTQISQLKSDYVEGMKKWNDVYFYYQNNDETYEKKKIIDIVEVFDEDICNLVIYPYKRTEKQIEEEEGEFNASTAPKGSNLIEMVDGIRHRHSQKWEMIINLDFILYNNNNVVRTGAHEMGHILGLCDIDGLEYKYHNVSYHHEELIMGYDTPRQSEITYQDLAGVAINRGFHTDNDHKWLYDTSSSTTNNHKLICSICNGVKYVSDLSSYTYNIYKSCNNNHTLSSNNMMPVGCYQNKDYIKCKYCRYIASPTDNVIQNYQYNNYNYLVHRSTSIINGLQYTIYESHKNTYSWNDLITHIASCVCNRVIQEGHAISSSALNNGQTTAPCLLCGGMASIGFIEIQNNIIMISDNGSYVLSNGIVVLVDSDIESYLNNTLVFRNPNEDIM